MSAKDCKHIDFEDTMDSVRCRDCGRERTCLARDIYCYIEATVEVDEKGNPDLNIIDGDYCIPDTGYYCGWCEDEFTTWDRVIEHLETAKQETK